MTQPLSMQNPSTPVDNPPWYRLPIVWMVIGGPAVVVVAALITVGIAVKNVDPVLDTSATPTQKEAPASKARNHANEDATPTAPAEK
ncbi:MAG: nitrogen fixation protein FixH [Aquabacterium sp.]|uniref:nitrogen fixation protein FixH n=1 Tax=Aquabacterium sp. TaxID=1872578 RepID=UPI002A367CBF|nr:nitrogen fixation protein FixH [Aquabacterium sp.]MDX9842710.1 nitrogen fixation protein FixH [Aquabacterium sp.]